MQIMTPIFGANLTDEQLVDTFQGLIEATNVETYVQDLAGKLKIFLWSKIKHFLESIPGLNEFFAAAESTTIRMQLNLFLATFLYMLSTL